MQLILSHKLYVHGYLLNSLKMNPIEKDSFLRIGSLRIGNLLGHTKGHHNNHNFIQRSSMQPPSSLDIKVHKNYGSVDNVSLPHSVIYKFMLFLFILRVGKLLTDCLWLWTFKSKLIFLLVFQPFL